MSIIHLRAKEHEYSKKLKFLRTSSTWNFPVLLIKTILRASLRWKMSNSSVLKCTQFTMNFLKNLGVREPVSENWLVCRTHANHTSGFYDYVGFKVFGVLHLSFHHKQNLIQDFNFLFFPYPYHHSPDKKCVLIME